MLTKNFAAAGCVAFFALVGCTTERSSSPTRTATEQLLISTAADRAARNLALQMPRDKKLYIDTSNLDRKSVVTGKRVSVRVNLGGRRLINKKQRNQRSRQVQPSHRRHVMNK